MSVWKAIKEEKVGYLFSLSDSLRIVEEQNTDLLHDLSNGTLVIASDYSGQHKQATHEAYTFLVTTDAYLTHWLPELDKFRAAHLPDGRRISFKNANEKVRWRAFPHFLRVAGNLRGNLITVLIDRRVGSFAGISRLDLAAALPDCFPTSAPDGTVEKMLRLASFVSLILAGLRDETQPSYWVSDHDEALDSDSRREQFAKLATYLTFGLTGWKAAANHVFGTTELQESPYWSEDLTAIADIVAAAYCKIEPQIPGILGRRNWVVGMSSSRVSDQRALLVGNWLAQGPALMKHVLLRLELTSDGEVRSSAQAFIGR